MRKKEAVRRMQERLYCRTHAADSPDKFRAKAKWWSLEGIFSAMPEECARYAMAQLFIAADMENRPHHHERKPLDKTRWQWSQTP